MLILQKPDGEKLALYGPRQILISSDQHDLLRVSVFLAGEIDASYPPMTRAELGKRVHGFLDPTVERP